MDCPVLPAAVLSSALLFFAQTALFTGRRTAIIASFWCIFLLILPTLKMHTNPCYISDP